MGIARFLTFDIPARKAPARASMAEPAVTAPSPSPMAPQHVDPCETAPSRDKIVQLPPVAQLGGHLIFD